MLEMWGSAHTGHYATYFLPLIHLWIGGCWSQSDGSKTCIIFSRVCRNLNRDLFQQNLFIYSIYGPFVRFIAHHTIYIILYNYCIISLVIYIFYS